MQRVAGIQPNGNYEKENSTEERVPEVYERKGNRATEYLLKKNIKQEKKKKKWGEGKKEGEKRAGSGGRDKRRSRKA